jgi:hypothetical protein
MASARIDRFPPRLTLCLSLTFAVFSAYADAERVVDDFEMASNPDQWGWTNVFGDAKITTEGGNPGAWIDTSTGYFAVHPYLVSEPPANSRLHAALASGHLQSASIDLQRLDTTDVSGCQPTHLQASFVSLSLIDLHSSNEEIKAHTTADISPAFPAGFFAWQTASFTIPSNSIDTPSGWILHTPAGSNYTWADLMRNIDSLRFYVGNPDQSAFSACSHLGADNVVINYTVDVDAIFTDGFGDNE